MSLLSVIIGALILIFGFVVARGAPYLPTFKKQADVALDMLNLKPGQTMLELGCGDGRVVRRAAERGINVVGYELNPILVLISKFRTLKYRRQVKIVWGDYWRMSWPATDGIYVFLLDRYMKKLDKKIIQTYPGRPLKMVSFVYKIPAKIPAKTQNSTHLYIY